MRLTPQRTGGLATCIDLKLNAAVELTTNIDVSDGLTNGVAGRICNWALAEDGRIAVLILVFSNPDCGAKARSTHCYVIKRLGGRPDWTPVYGSLTRFILSPSSSVEVPRMQFAVRLCAARTIHRVQGQSLEGLVIDLTGSCAVGSHYVAASRIVEANNIWFLNANLARVSCAAEVLAEYT